MCKPTFNLTKIPDGETKTADRATSSTQSTFDILHKSEINTEKKKKNEVNRTDHD